jgi:excinuclease ABC subunit C
VEYVLCQNEKEALLLECSLIKEYKPPFNIRLRDDKTYPWVMITDEPFPRLFITRRVQEEGRFFGPFTQTGSLRKVLRILREFFPLRICKKMKKKPCLNFYMRKCIAPCTGRVKREDYLKNVEAASLFLSGKYKEVVHLLECRMKELAQQLRFEEAARLRDAIESIQKVVNAQRVVMDADEQMDVVGCSQGTKKGGIFLLCIREGRIVDQKRFLFSLPPTQKEEELIDSFLKQYYLQQQCLPSKILLPYKVPDQSLLEELLHERVGKKVKILQPKRGRGRQLLSFAQENASLLLKEESDPLVQLRTLCRLPSLPLRIEALDISNISGREATGSFVVFEEGRAKKDEYRRFKIRGESVPNDVAMIKEVVYRHFQRKKSEGRKLPDLLVVDGGKAQLNAAVSVLLELGFDAVGVLAFPKGEEAKVFVKGRRESVRLHRYLQAHSLLCRIRNEAHRFAIRYHRILRREAWK